MSQESPTHSGSTLWVGDFFHGTKVNVFSRILNIYYFSRLVVCGSILSVVLASGNECQLPASIVIKKGKSQTDAVARP